MENENEPMAPAGSSEDQYLWMRRHLATTMVILIVVIAAFDIFLLRQVQYSKMDTNVLRSTYDDYAKTNGAPVEYFLQRTFAYAEAHEDFRPVLAKFGLIIVSNPPPAKPGSMAIPPTAAPKK